MRHVQFILLYVTTILLLSVILGDLPYCLIRSRPAQLSFNTVMVTRDYVDAAEWDFAVDRRDADIRA